MLNAKEDIKKLTPIILQDDDKLVIKSQGLGENLRILFLILAVIIPGSFFVFAISEFLQGSVSNEEINTIVRNGVLLLILFIVGAILFGRIYASPIITFNRKDQKIYINRKKIMKEIAVEIDFDEDLLLINEGIAGQTSNRLYYLRIPPIPEISKFLPIDLTWKLTDAQDAIKVRDYIIEFMSFGAKKGLGDDKISRVIQTNVSLIKEVKNEYDLPDPQHLKKENLKRLYGLSLAAVIFIAIFLFFMFLGIERVMSDDFKMNWRYDLAELITTIGLILLPLVCVIIFVIMLVDVIRRIISLKKTL